MRRYMEELKSKEEELKARLAAKEQGRKQQEAQEERIRKQKEEEERLARLKLKEEEQAKKMAQAAAQAAALGKKDIELVKQELQPSISATKPFTVQNRKSQPSQQANSVKGGSVVSNVESRVMSDDNFEEDNIQQQPSTVSLKS